MELRKEYEAIAQQFASSIYDCTGLGEAHDIVRNAVTACQELADRPPKELTASEKYDLWLSCYGGHFAEDDFRCKNGTEVIDKIIAAFLAKQREPETVKVRLYRHKDEGYINAATGSAVDSPLNPIYDWCSPVQEIEVRT